MIPLDMVNETDLIDRKRDESVDDCGERVSECDCGGNGIEKWCGRRSNTRV